jgi:hypothetical protein
MKWMGQGAKRPVDVCSAPTEVKRRTNLRCFFVTDLQSAAFATRLPIQRGDQKELNPHKQIHNLPDCRYPMATVIPTGLEPSISGLKDRCPDLLD